MTRHSALSSGLSYGILSALDSEQRKAAEILTGQVLILAGSGCGKTRTLTHRIAHLITSKTAKPEECLALTLTQYACVEMKERLKKLLGKSGERVLVHTFESFGLQILKENRENAGLPRGFRPANRKELLALAVKAAGWVESRAEAALEKMLFLKRRGDRAEAKSDEAALNTLFEEWREHGGWLDDADLIRIPLKLFDGHSEIADLYRGQHRFISVDDYQNIDSLKHRLLRCLAESDANLCIAGNPRQVTEYSRGADGCFLEQFEKEYPFVHKAYLKRNYRSGDSIVEAAAKVVKKVRFFSANIEGVSAVGETGSVTVFEAGSDRAEAEYIARTIDKLQNASQALLPDIAVYCRTAGPFKMLEDALKRSQIPFQYFSHQALEGEPAVRGRGIFLMTLDEAKGREFQTVFIMGCEDGIIPLRQGSPDDEKFLEAERCLFYAGMNRAKSQLFLTHAAKRLFGETIKDQPPSPFLKSIEAVAFRQSLSASSDGSNTAAKTQLDLF